MDVKYYMYIVYHLYGIINLYIQNKRNLMPQMAMWYLIDTCTWMIIENWFNQSANHIKDSSLIQGCASVAGCFK